MQHLLLPRPPAQAVHAHPRPVRVLHLWHLLSLDAPTVATLWTALVAHASGIHLPAATLFAMFVMIWALYVADRLLDAQPLHRQPTIAADLERRHLFHHLHRRPFLLILGVATPLLAILIPQISPASLRLFLILGTLLAGYFVLIHATSGAHRLPKEIAVGLFFSAAVFIPTIAHLAPLLRLALVPLAFLFAALCCLNCLCIYAWEHPSAASATPHPLTQAALHHRQLLASAILLASILCAFVLPQIVIAAALALSSLALLLLDRDQHRLSSLTLRAAADLALVTPALFLPWLLLH